MHTIDTVTADAIEVGDLIRVKTGDEDFPVDIFRVDDVVDRGDAIFVYGYSEVAGDSTEYLLDPDQIVDLMGA